MKVFRLLYFTALVLPPAASAQLTAPYVQEVARNPYLLSAMVAKDLDGDGDDDLILHGSQNHLTVWCRNDSGVFSHPQEIPMAPRIFNGSMPDLADLEGDGKDDFYTRDARTRTRNLGGGNFSAPEAWPGGTWPHPNDEEPEYSDTFLTPLPGIGGKDKIVFQRMSWNGSRSLFLITTGQNGELASSPLLVNGAPYTYWGDLERPEVQWLDVDLDGDADFVRSDQDFSYLEVYRNRGDDTFDAGVDAVHQGASTTLFDVAPVLLSVPGRTLPSVISYRRRSTSSAPYIDFYLAIRAQTLDASGYRFEAEDPAHRISFGRDELTGMVTLEGTKGQELWIRLKMFASDEPLRDRVRAYRYDPIIGWIQFVDQAIPARGYGDIQLLHLTPGGLPGLAFRMGGKPGDNLTSEDKVLWSSLVNLRAETPGWQTIAGPFNDFKDMHVDDLDADAKLDLISGERDHGLSYGRNGRFHLFHDLNGERKHSVIDTESTENFGYGEPLPGNRVAIGDIDGDDLPDLAVSDGLANTISLLGNLGNRSFSAPETRAAGGTLFIPLRLGPAGLMFQDEGQVFTQAPAAGSPPIPSYDLGVPAYLVHCDMDNDGDPDMVAHPCPLGNVIGWGETGPLGEIIGWHLLSSEEAREIRTPGSPPALGWISYATEIPEFKQVVEGMPGVASSPLPEVFGSIHDLVLWPPVDLDGDGDFDRLFLSRPPAAEWFQIEGERDLRWVENQGNTAIQHPQPLLRTFYPSSNDHGATLQLIGTTGGKPHILFGNGAGEVFFLDFTPQVPGGSFGAWLGSFGLSGSSAGAEADPDADGLSNLEEALLGSSPIVPTPGGFRLPVSLAGLEGWSFSSALALADSGVKVTTETSDDLDEWTVLSNEVEPDGERDGRFLYQVPDGGIAEEERRFVRFKFSWEAE